jgi:hypothetical protein
MEFSGSINYVAVSRDNDNVKLALQGVVSMIRGFLEYPATPIWNTVWRVYDPYGRLLKEDTRSHSIMFFSQTDSAADDIALTVPVASYYQVQLWGKLSGGEKLVDAATVSLSYEPVPSPAPVVPTPLPEPSPVPMPLLPAPTPTPGYVPPYLPTGPAEAIDWKGLIPAGIMLAAVLLLSEKPK